MPICLSSKGWAFQATLLPPAAIGGSRMAGSTIVGCSTEAMDIKDQTKSKVGPAAGITGAMASGLPVASNVDALNINR